MLVKRNRESPCAQSSLGVPESRGFHFRSDIVAGQEFGTVMALGLMQNPQFQREMTAAQSELHLAGLAP